MGWMWECGFMPEIPCAAVVEGWCEPERFVGFSFVPYKHYKGRPKTAPVVCRKILFFIPNS